MGYRPLGNGCIMAADEEVMDEEDGKPNIDPGEPDPRDQTQRRLIRVAGSGSLWCATALGNISRLFMISLGGSAFDVALLETLSQTTPLG